MKLPLLRLEKVALNRADATLPLWSSQRTL